MERSVSCETHSLAARCSGRSRSLTKPALWASIAFIDESGLSERPTLVRGWAPVGQPVIQYSFHWTQLSAIGGISFWQFYFRLFPGCQSRCTAARISRRAARTDRRPAVGLSGNGLNVHPGRLLREWFGE